MTVQNHLHRGISKVRAALMDLSKQVQSSIEQAVQSIREGDMELARAVIEGDERIDDLEVELEEDCLKLLALYQPVAKDLRFIVAVIKIINDLERMGDLSANIASRAKYLKDLHPKQFVYPFAEMSQHAIDMVSLALKAVFDMDIESAYRVRKMDDYIDNVHRNAFQQVHKEMANTLFDVEALTSQLSISRYLERISDLATNIAEDAIYAVEGTIMRHQHKI